MEAEHEAWYSFNAKAGPLELQKDSLIDAQTLVYPEKCLKVWLYLFWQRIDDHWQGLFQGWARFNVNKKLIWCVGYDWAKFP